MTLPRGFPQRLRFFRTESGLSVAQLAAAVGVTPARAYQWEAGANCTLARLDMIAAALGINARLLLDGPEAADEPGAE